MCGIVGLQLKDPSLYPRLGALLTPMLLAMSERGPDSAGVALYEDGLPEGWFRYSLRASASRNDWDGLVKRLAESLGADAKVRKVADDAVITVHADPERFLPELAQLAPEVRVFAFGRAMEIYKDVGPPAAICERYGIADRSGYQGLGHTRMATESAVTTDHSHPFGAAADLCLVHNGSFSNYATVRRQLSDEGVAFQTDNDSEVAARFIAQRMARGADLVQALEQLMATLDGFFTLLVASRTQFAVVRDAFACKPAVIAESDDYVAMASEYRALAELPGVAEARIFEPMPKEIHVWSR
ncbi:MAG: amidophosphoribosyltransferase [Dehalococcoidia bacterium]